MSAEIIITILIIALWAIHSSHQRKERETAERLAKLKTVAVAIDAIANTPPVDDETVRKAAIMARIAKIGILQCDQTNLHLR